MASTMKCSLSVASAAVFFLCIFTINLRIGISHAERLPEKERVELWKQRKSLLSDHSASDASVSMFCVIVLLSFQLDFTLSSLVYLSREQNLINHSAESAEIYTLTLHY